jgi:hypothetical protein
MHGETLQQRLKRRPIDATELAPIVDDVLLDFGVAKSPRRTSDENRPDPSAFDATLDGFAYMAPEQVRGAAAVDQARWPDALETFVAKMMARDRNTRFDTATQALAAWRKATFR